MFYRHYKGGIYYSLGVTSRNNDISLYMNGYIKAIHTEDEVSMSVLMKDNRFYVTTEKYSNHMLYIDINGKFWLRPKDMFHGVLEDGTKRFTLL